MGVGVAALIRKRGSLHLPGRLVGWLSKVGAKGGVLLAIVTLSLRWAICSSSSRLQGVGEPQFGHFADDCGSVVGVELVMPMPQARHDGYCCGGVRAVGAGDGAGDGGQVAREDERTTGRGNGEGEGEEEDGKVKVVGNW